MGDNPKWLGKLEHEEEAQRKAVTHVARRDTEYFGGKRNWIWASKIGDNENYCFAGYDAVNSRRSVRVFWRGLAASIFKVNLGSPETPVHFYRSTRRHIPEDSSLRNACVQFCVHLLKMLHNPGLNLSPGVTFWMDNDTMNGCDFKSQSALKNNIHCRMLISAILTV